MWPTQRGLPPLRRRLPQRCVAFERRIGRLEVVIRHHTQHVVGSVVALLHPGVDVVAAFELPLVHTRRMTEHTELFRDPECPIAIAPSVTDEDIRHARRPA